MVPEAKRPTCARCGAYDPEGPAVALGFRICLACYEWRPARVERIHHVALALGVAVAPFVLSGLVLAIARTWLERRVGRAAVDGLIDIGAWVLVAFAALGVLGVATWAAVGVRRTIRALALPVHVFLLEGATPVWAAVHLSKDPRPSALRSREMACVVASDRGVLVMGPTVRIAAPWADLTLAEMPLRSYGSLRLTRRGVEEHLHIFGLAPQRRLLLERVPRAAGAP